MLAEPAGQPVLFGVGAEVSWPGAVGLAYQWRLNGQAVPGADQSALAFIADASSSGVYDCVVSYAQCGGAAGVNQAVTLPVTLTLRCRARATSTRTAW